MKKKIKSEIKNLCNTLFGQFKIKDNKVLFIGEEIASPSYKLLKNAEFIIDVGANYGSISAVLSEKSSTKKLIFIEPNTDLVPYIKENGGLNNVNNYELINSICGEDGRRRKSSVETD